MAQDKPSSKPEKRKPQVYMVNKAGVTTADQLTHPGYMLETDPIKAAQVRAAQKELRAKQDVMTASREVEDAFSTFSETVVAAGDQGLSGGMIRPPFDFDIVAEMANRNNILPPLIDAMEVNVDGTGAAVVPKEQPEDDEEQARLEEQAGLINEFFDEPWPGESFLTIRRKLRRDLESIGNAYLEVMRNPEGEIIFVRWVDAKGVRLIRLGEPIIVRKSVMRGGQELEIEVNMRERRYVQALGGKTMWFREFGASRSLDKFSGQWQASQEEIAEAEADRANTGQANELTGEIQFERQANELIHFVMKKDTFTPYGLPRWWSNTPSVVGSRKAEEFNLNFFDAGGIPPLLIIVSGGSLAENAERALREQFMNTGEMRHQASIMEAYATDGDMDHPANVKVQVERFGSERQKDSMFEMYIENCDGRVQRSFRLPSIFLGMSQDFNFATALASMMVAEAQVFKCERTEFDEVINLKLMPELDPTGEFMYESRPLGLKDAKDQLAALGMVKGDITREDFVKHIGEAVGLDLVVDDDADAREAEDREFERGLRSRESEFRFTPGIGAGNRVQDGNPDNEGNENEPNQANKAEHVLTGVLSLAQRAATCLGRGISNADDAAALREVILKVDTLNPRQKAQFNVFLSTELYPEWGHDPRGSAEMAAGVLDLVGRGLR